MFRSEKKALLALYVDCTKVDTALNHLTSRARTILTSMSQCACTFVWQSTFCNLCEKLTCSRSIKPPKAADAKSKASKKDKDTGKSKDKSKDTKEKHSKEKHSKRKTRKTAPVKDEEVEEPRKSKKKKRS